MIITKENEPEITVDNIEVAQFIYLMLNNQKVRDVIDTITFKAVLILGRFTAIRSFETPRVHHAAWPRGGGVAARGTGAASSRPVAWRSRARERRLRSAAQITRTYLKIA